MGTQSIFQLPYSRSEFLNFLRRNFLPEDFTQEETNIEFAVKTQFTTKATKLGVSKSVDLVVYEIKHSGKQDPRVTLSKEAFRLLAQEWQSRALVLFVPKDKPQNYRFSLIEIKLEGKADSPKIERKYSNPRRYSYYLGEGVGGFTPNKYLIEKGRVTNAKELTERFSVEVLTKEFYQELQDWYFWAVKIIRFPNDINDSSDDDKFNSECAIRLITRLIFVWFLKQKKLVPNEFFDEEYIADNFISGFDPHVHTNLFGKSDESKYYKAILQNLFFAMLNSPITPDGTDEIVERRFTKGREDYNNNKLMRYKSLFIDPQKFVDIANKTVPFLNGGLFHCLDDKDKGLYIDAFSNKKDVYKSLIVPDYLFFGEEVGKEIDLSEFYNDKKKKKVSARGIIDILKRYNFTVEENTPFDQEVSLDPELLGKVFENLLASYNPETKTTARKQTGSFYTPREIVQYMVDESLIAHLKRTVGEALEPEYRKLMQLNNEDIHLTEEQKDDVMKALFSCKVLDPACGSGAFPVGMLQQMVHILTQLDPDNSKWKNILIKNAIDETSEAYHNASNDERKEAVNDIEKSFNEQFNYPDYARKLYLIENCIYGVDIQPIAVQISKLRFFISLVIDQKPNSNAADNFGIRPLPNLEAKFVAANSLIGLKNTELSIFDTEEIKEKQAQLKIANHKIFGAKTVRTKRKYEDIVRKLRVEIASILEDLGAVGSSEAQDLTKWDMFDQNTFAPLFDPEYMFGVSGGFDIVIGNPPYIDAKEQIKNEVLSQQRKKLSQDKRFQSLYQKWDLYIAFLEIGIKHFCVENGVCTMIVPYPLSNQLYAQKLRQMIVDSYDMIEMVDLNGVTVFENATVTNCIPFVRKSHRENKVIISNADKSKYITHSFEQSFDNLVQDKKTLIWNFTQENRKGNKHSDMHILGDYCYISVGMVLNADEKKAKGEFVKADLINTTYNEIHCKKYIEGKDLERYNVKRVRFLEWGTKRCPDALRRPTFPELYTSQKLLINALGEMKASIDTNKEFYCEQQVRMALLWNDLKDVSNKSIISSIKKFSTMKRHEMEFLSKTVELHFLLGILNSKYASSLLSDIRGGDYHIVPEHIRNIPIPTATKEEQTPIISVVNRILDTKKNNPNADTTALETQIDFLVYKLYQLTYDEVLVIDAQTPITRAEYEA